MGKRGGFTLVEVLGALAVASIILVATAGLIHNVALSFDRGTRRTDEGERLLLASDRLAADFGSARFVLRRNVAGTTAAFTGDAASVTFVASGGIGLPRQGEELVTLRIELQDELSRLVRRRAAWLEPHDRFEVAPPADPVVLIDGRVDMAFRFARAGADGGLTWSNAWTGEFGLPRFVRLTVLERETGVDLLAGSEFLVRADAPPACAHGASPDSPTQQPALPGTTGPAPQAGPAPASKAGGLGCLSIDQPNAPPSADSGRRAG
jgi:prepilin-type N-terminal cleavage/methylation domain-containing protein